MMIIIIIIIIIYKSVNTVDEIFYLQSLPICLSHRSTQCTLWGTNCIFICNCFHFSLLRVGMFPWSVFDLFGLCFSLLAHNADFRGQNQYFTCVCVCLLSNSEQLGSRISSTADNSLIWFMSSTEITGFSPKPFRVLPPWRIVLKWFFFVCMSQ